MKVCPYCGKEVGNRIYETDSKLFEDYDYVFKDGREGYFVDYIVTCHNCNGEFYWTEIFQKVTTIITNADMNEVTEYKEERD